MVSPSTDNFQSMNAQASKHLEDGASSPAPIYNLPNEILCMIIREAYEHDPTRCYLEVPSSLPDPWVISHVSQHLRNLAFAMPQIWNCIHVDVDRPSTLHQNKYFYLLERSSPLEVSAHFRCLKTEPQDPRPMMRSPTFPLWMRGDRLAHCTITTACPPLVQPVVGLINMFPNIRSLHIEPTMPHQILEDMDYKKAAPLLTSLHLKRVLLASDCPLFHNLQELVLCDYTISVHYLRDILQSAPHLFHLTLDTIVVDSLDLDDLNTITHTIELPSLRTLKMHRLWDHDTILARLVAPQLEYLEIASPIDESENVLPSVWATYTPSMREVRAIRVEFDLVIDTIHNIRRLTPTVTTLDLSDTLADGFLEAMTRPEPLMPLLSKLIVTRLDNHSLLAKLVDQRQKTENPITEIKLGKPLGDELSTEIRQSLERSVDIKAAEPVSMPRYWLRPPGPRGFVLSDDEGLQAEDEDEDFEDEWEAEGEVPQTDEEEM